MGAMATIRTAWAAAFSSMSPCFSPAPVHDALVVVMPTRMPIPESLQSFQKAKTFTQSTKTAKYKTSPTIMKLFFLALVAMVAADTLRGSPARALQRIGKYDASKDHLEGTTRSAYYCFSSMTDRLHSHLSHRQWQFISNSFGTLMIVTALVPFACCSTTMASTLPS